MINYFIKTIIRNSSHMKNYVMLILKLSKG